jgi:hypothetical protein
MIASTSSSPHVSEQLAHNSAFLISKERFRLGRDPTMASKQLNCSLACPTQVVLEYETRCLNVKLLIFLALHYKNTKFLGNTMWEEQMCSRRRRRRRWRRRLNKGRTTRDPPEQEITLSSLEWRESVIACAYTANIWT